MAAPASQLIPIAFAGMDSDRRWPLDKFEIGIRRFMEDFMIQWIAESDAIVSHYMTDDAFQPAVLRVLAREIFESVQRRERGYRRRRCSLRE